MSTEHGWAQQVVASHDFASTDGSLSAEHVAAHESLSDVPFAGPVFVESQPWLGTFRSRYGVLHYGPTDPQRVRFRAGVLGTVGTHTEAMEAEFGVTGMLPLGDWRLTYDGGVQPGAFDKQWSYDFDAFQSITWLELGFETPLIDRRDSPRRWGGGVRLDWYDAQPLPFGNQAENDLGDSILGLNQRLGTYFLQRDRYLPSGALHRWRFEFRNDESSILGDGGDQFQTAKTRLLFLRQQDLWQARLGFSLELFTGQTIRDRVRLVQGKEVYVTEGLLFADRSVGLIELETGLSRFWQVGRGRLELGCDVRLGPDTEAIRNFFQNDVVHTHVVIRPRVPTVPRLDRFKTDVGLFLIYHF